MKLSTRLSIYMLCTGVFVFAAITMVLNNYSSRSESGQIHRLSRLMQSQLVQRINDNLMTVTRNVDRTAREIEALGKELDETNAAEILSIMIESNPMITGGAIAMVPEAPDGREWMLYACRTDSALSVRQLGGTDYGYTLKEWYLTPQQKESAVWSQPYIDHGGGECLMTTFARPMTDSKGRVRAIVTADVALQSIDHAIDSLKPYHDSRSFLITPDGNTIEGDVIPEGSGNEELLRQIKLQIKDGQSNDNDTYVGRRQYLTSFSSVPDLGLLICTVTPYDTIEPVIKQLRMPLGLIMVAAFLLLLIAVRLVFGLATRPLNRLTAAAINIGKGDFSTPLPDTGSDTDIRRLRDAMAYMASSINSYMDRIAREARQRERIESELGIAAAIQRSMLPQKDECPSKQTKTGTSISTFLEPAREVSGDIYDYVVRGKYVYFMIADVSDKGIPAALCTVAIRSLFRFAAEQQLTPAAILGKINLHICDNNTQNMFATLVAGRYDTESCTLTLSNAGHNPPLLFEGRTCRYLNLAPVVPVGVLNDACYTDTGLAFGPGDMLMLYTDGLTEAENTDGKQFGQKRLLQLADKLRSDGSDTPQEIIDAIRLHIREFASLPLADDITMLCLSVPSAVQCHLNLSYDIGEISRIAAAVGNIAEKCSWDKSLVMRVNLVLEEAVTNIINYSTPKSKSVIEVRIDSSHSAAMLHISDSGPAFDPLTHMPEVNTTAPAEQRPTGGLGIFLIRRMAASAQYIRTNDQNHLRISLTSDYHENND